MGRQMSSHLHKRRVPSHIMVPWEDKCHNLEYSPLKNPKQISIPGIVKNTTSAKTSISCKRDALLCTFLMQEGKDVFSYSLKSPFVLKLTQRIG